MKPALFQITLKIFLCSEDRFLILKDAAAQVGDLPGGRFGPGEIYRPWLESARRELSEELGATVADAARIEAEPRFYFPHFVTESGYEALGIAYRAEITPELRQAVRLSPEHDWFDWVSIADYNPATLFVDHLHDAVARFQSVHRA
ncbi:MAG: NUDIX domain-containing protein [bacterium]|nr:NUDIX domain-containing protein [bacterium]